MFLGLLRYIGMLLGLLRYLGMLLGLLRYIGMLLGLLRYTDMLLGLLRYTGMLLGLLRYTGMLLGHSATDQQQQPWVVILGLDLSRGLRLLTVISQRHGNQQVVCAACYDTPHRGMVTSRWSVQRVMTHPTEAW